MSLFERITTCSNAFKHARGEGGNGDGDGDGDGHASSYEEVMLHLPPEKATEHKATNLSLASVEYLKLGFPNKDTPVRKVNIALYIAVLKANGDDTTEGLAKEICDRFRSLRDFDRDVMTKIFNFSICTDRVRLLLDTAMTRKTRSIHRAIEHEFRVEFVLLFFRSLEAAVRRASTESLGHLALADVSPAHIERARGMVEQHASSIAAKFGSCFELKAFKAARRQNNLFPANGAFPRVSVGCRHIDFDKVTVETLRGSLGETPEKHGFLEAMRAVILHASHGDRPAATYAKLRQKSAKDFFVGTVLDPEQARDVARSSLSLPDAPTECALREERDLLRQNYRSAGEAIRKHVTEISRLRQENLELKERLDRREKVIRELTGTNHTRKRAEGQVLNKRWLMGQSLSEGRAREDNDE